MPQLHDAGHHGGGGGENISLSSYSSTPNSLHGAPTHLWSSRRGRESNFHQMNRHCGLSALLLSSFLRYKAQRAAGRPSVKGRTGGTTSRPPSALHEARQEQTCLPTEPTELWPPLPTSLPCICYPKFSREVNTFSE